MPDRVIKEGLKNLIPIFAKAAVGDFSIDPKIPDEDGEAREVCVGIKIMLDAIREKIADFEKTNGELQQKVKELNKLLNIMVGREIKMSELKGELRTCREDLKKLNK